MIRINGLEERIRRLVFIVSLSPAVKTYRRSRQGWHGGEEKKGCLSTLDAGCTALLLAKPLHPLPSLLSQRKILTLAWLVGKTV